MYYMIIAQGIMELVGIGLFLGGYLFQYQVVIIIGGLIMVLDDALEIILGILNPLLPILLAVILAFILSPWYVGMFWSIAVFKVFGIPTSIKKCFKPKMVLQAIESQHQLRT